jgi:hypothetical protein
VKHLESRARIEHLTRHAAEHPRAEYHEYRPYLLALDLEISRHDIVHHAVGRGEGLGDDAVHLAELGAKTLLYFFHLVHISRQN